MREKVPELRLLLVGSQRFGANAVASSILGHEGPRGHEWGRRAVQSMSHSALVDGTLVQLVKAPVWLRSYHLRDTAELVKQELVLSLTRCTPGPHAIVLLCEVDLPFTSACADAVAAHLGLFGEQVWRHTVLLFTCGDWLGRTSLEDYVKGEGPPLAALLDRCGHRYVMDSTGAPPLSRRLLAKVQELLTINKGAHFIVDQLTLERTNQSREEVTRRAELRRRRRTRRDEGVPSGTQDFSDSSLSEITVVLLGWVFAVKTKVCCSLLGIPERPDRTTECTRTSMALSERLRLTVVDTPGWWKYFSADLVPGHARAQIHQGFRAFEEAGGSPASGRAVLLMIPADTSFTWEQLSITRDNMRPLGRNVWRSTILVFTRGHWLGHFTIEDHIESEGEALVCLVEQCGNRYFVFDGDADQVEKETQGKQLLRMVLDLCESAPDQDRNQDVKEDLTVTPNCIAEGLTSPPVDEDLRKMVAVLHRVWVWGLWEIEEFAARFFERPMYEFTDLASMHLTNMFRGSSDRSLIKQPREDVERILRKEMEGKSLEEVVEAALQIYFRKEVGAFDILSIICEKDQFKLQWKSLFEREWARREVRLTEYVFIRFVKAGADEARKLIESCSKVSAWLNSMPPSVEELVRMITQKLQSRISPALSSKRKQGSVHAQPPVTP